LYEDYKANRKKGNKLNAEEAAELKDFHRQKELIKSMVLPQMGFRNNFEIEGLEADDIIAAIALSNSALRKIVISSDEDLFQLLDHCSMFNISKKTTTSREVFQRTYGISPLDWIQVKAICGCSTDNVRGLPGIGIKTVIKYLTGTLSSKAALKKIKEGEDIIQRNLTLVRLPFQPISDCAISKEVFYTQDFVRVWEEYGLDSFRKPEKFGRWGRNFRLKSKGD
jgi:DNA polymerase-1